MTIYPVSSEVAYDDNGDPFGIAKVALFMDGTTYEEFDDEYEEVYDEDYGYFGEYYGVDEDDVDELDCG